MKKSVLVGLIVAVTVVIAGCEDVLPIGSGGPVTGVALDPSSLVLGMGGGTATLTATVSPANAANKAVTWASDDETVATVDETGKVTGVAAGSTVITVTTVDGGKTATCAVTCKLLPFTIANVDDWNNAITVINGLDGGSAGSPEVFTLQITGDFSVAGLPSGSNIDGGDLKDHKEVRLTGNKTITLFGAGSLIRTAATQTFVIDGPALQGIADNTYPLVDIVDGSTVELLAGAIQGNNNTNSTGAPGTTGGGVLVNSGGTFTMDGGTVSGNTARKGGGGVYVNQGTFTMNGGTIGGDDSSGNTASGESGGGVYVIGNGGSFTMENGSIVSGNKADNSGGGVAVYNNGTFTMKTGSTVSGNKANMANPSPPGAFGGGGVAVISNGVFKMEDGTISGNEVISGSLKGGGGVYVSAYNGNFTMDKGTITENTADKGGGVYVHTASTFTMTDGTISGNTASTKSGVFAENGSFTNSGGTVQAN
jgi:hypothetical protein